MCSGIELYGCELFVVYGIWEYMSLPCYVGYLVYNF